MCFCRLIFHNQATYGSYVYIGDWFNSMLLAGFNIDVIFIGSIYHYS